MTISKRFLSGVLALAMGVAPALAEPFDPTGIWEASDGESRYDVSLCGDGTQLCGKLIWIRPDVINERNKSYIDTYIVNGARRVSDREWRGTISLYGVNVAGSVTRLGADLMQVRGCALVIICERQIVSRIADSAAALAE